MALHLMNCSVDQYRFLDMTLELSFCVWNNNLLKIKSCFQANISIVQIIAVLLIPRLGILLLEFLGKTHASINKQTHIIDKLKVNQQRDS